MSLSHGSTGVVLDVEEADGITGLDEMKAKERVCSKRLGIRRQGISVLHSSFHMSRSPACNGRRTVPRFSFNMSIRLTTVNYSVNFVGKRPPLAF